MLTTNLLREAKMKKGHGTPVSGDRFFDREADVKALLEVVKEGGHRSLVAQRRMGKSSLALEVCERLRKDEDCVALYADIQHADSPEDAIKEFLMVMQPYDALWKKALRPFSNIFSTVFDRIKQVSLYKTAIQIQSALNAGNWRDKGDKLFDVMANHDKRILLVIDELSIFLIRLMRKRKNDGQGLAEGRKDAELFMHWLRKNAQKHNHNVSIFILGSIGLAPVLKRAGLSATLDAFPNHQLNPWDQTTTSQCLDALAGGYNIMLGEGVGLEIHRLLGGGIPHYVQSFFDQLHFDATSRGAAEITVSDVKRIYQTVLLSTRGSAELEHYETRLKLALGRQKYILALDLLTQVACVGPLKAGDITLYREEYAKQIDNVEEAIKDILGTLEHDGYLTQQEEGYAFAFRLLGEWWRGRHCQSFTPIDKRRP